MSPDLCWNNDWHNRFNINKLAHIQFKETEITFIGFPSNKNTTIINIVQSSKYKLAYGSRIIFLIGNIEK